MENLADLVEKTKRNTGDMELLIERFTPLIRHLFKQYIVILRQAYRIIQQLFAALLPVIFVPKVKAAIFHRGRNVA